MTTVLIALDASDEARAAAETAYRIFGPDAHYLAISVADVPTPAETYAFGSVYGYPYPPVVPASTDPEQARDVEVAARAQAAELAAEAGLDSAQPLGDIGDPVEAITDAADAHDVDVIVAGWHPRGFLARVFETSVAETLIKRARVPVLIVPSHND